MFDFFKQKCWLLWSWGGLTLIVATAYVLARIDGAINEWFGTFYDKIQFILNKTEIVSQYDFIFLLLTFWYYAGIWVLISTIKDFFASHWVFRWRTSMTEKYHSHYDRLRNIEGASQRIQEDTLKFARMLESLGSGFLDSFMTLLVFLPILWELSKKISLLPWIGEVPHALIYVSIITAIGGTALLAMIGIKLPGIEYDIQKEEAAYRKELVLGEDNISAGKPESLKSLFERVRKIHFKSYLHYGYFNLMKWSYFQGMVIVPYIALTPTIISAAVTFGFIQQIVRAFGRVESSLQFLVRSWSTIVELMSVYKRLREFERNL